MSVEVILLSEEVKKLRAQRDRLKEALKKIADEAQRLAEAEEHHIHK